MSLRSTRDGDRHLYWDDDVVEAPEAEIFDPDWWCRQGRLTGEAIGRGAAYFVSGLDGREWVLRHNRRGGLLAHVNRDRFLFAGIERARPVRELALLAELRRNGLPVPAPVAASVERRGLFYRGDLITVCIAGATPLADRLSDGAWPSAGWQRLGRVMAAFHEAGVWHADLNARNILVDDADDIHLIDFDKARLRPIGPWQTANLDRLRRSLDKFARAHGRFHFRQADWRCLCNAYDAARAEVL